jgi:hypothetical protein
MTSMAPTLRVTALSFVVILALVLAAPELGHAAPTPSAAVEAIAKVRRVAEQKDYAALRSAMVEDFRWSFGGDASAEQALAEWQQQPRYLQQLVKATAARCVLQSDGYVECRAGAKASFRAGFTLHDGRWKFAYFVEGD